MNILYIIWLIISEISENQFTIEVKPETEEDRNCPTKSEWRH